MVNPLENRLAVHIMRDFFGEVAENVCTTVIQHGETTFEEILSKSRRVEKHKIKRMIYILLKQRCLRFFSKEVKGKVETKYTFHSSDIFNFIRHPNLLKHFNSDLEIDECKIFVYLLLHGRLDSVQRKSIDFASFSTSVNGISIDKHLEDVASKTDMLSSLPMNGTQYRVWSINSDKNEVSKFYLSNCSRRQSTKELDAENKLKMDRTTMRKNANLTPLFMTISETDKVSIQNVIESVVHQRFGLLAKRIFRLLFVNRRLDQKEISEMAMLPIKQTREILYKLFKSEYVKIQEVSRTSDHAPSRTFYFWYVDLECIRHKMIRNCFQACLNVSVVLSKKYSDVERGSILCSEQILYQYCADRGKMVERASFNIQYLENVAFLIANMSQIMVTTK